MIVKCLFDCAYFEKRALLDEILLLCCCFIGGTVYRQTLTHFVVIAYLLTFSSFSDEQYVTRAASALRNGLKEPAKSQALKNETFSYNATTWSNGAPGTKTAVETLSKAGL